MKAFAAVVLFVLIVGNALVQAQAQHSGYCPTCVVTTSTPGTGIAHFAGGNQTVTSTKVVPADVDFSSLTGLVRGGTPPTAAELSGDATTSLSNAVTVSGVNNLPVPLSATVVGTNSSKQLVAASLTGTQSEVVVSAGLGGSAGTPICDDGSGNATESGCVGVYSVDQAWTSGSTPSILLGTAQTLIPSSAPTGLYRIDAEIAQTNSASCGSYGTVSMRLSYVDYKTNVTYALSDAASNMIWLPSNSSGSLTLLILFTPSSSLTTSSAQYGSKVIYFKSGTSVAAVQAYQNAADSLCAPHPTFQTTVAATRIK